MLDRLKEMLIVWMKRRGSSRSASKKGSTGITCEPVMPLITPVTKPASGASVRARLGGIGRGTCQPDSDRSLKISVDFVAVPLAAASVGKFTAL